MPGRKVADRTATGGRIYGELKDEHGANIRVARMVIPGSDLCRITCLGDSNEDEPLVLTKETAALLIGALKVYISDQERIQHGHQWGS